jgi:hypothetical protein
MNATEISKNPDLDRLSIRLKNQITNGRDDLRDCFRDLNEALNSGKGKKATVHLSIITYAARAALEYDNSTAVLLRAIEFLPSKATSEDVMLGAIKVPRSPARDKLIYGLAGFSETPLSPNLSFELAKTFGKDFPHLGTAVWDWNRFRHSDSNWCRWWGSLCQEIVYSFIPSQDEVARTVLDDLIIRIESLQGTPSRVLGPLVLFLFSRENPGLNTDQRERLAKTATALQARHLIDGPTVIQIPQTLGNIPTVSEQSGPVTSVPSLSLDGISPKVIHSLSLLRDELQTIGQESARDQMRLAELELECNRFRAELEDALRKETRFKNELGYLNLQMKETNSSLQREKETAKNLKERVERMDHQMNQVMAERDLKLRDLQDAKEAYIRLDKQCAQEKEDLHTQIFTGLHLELQEPWKSMALMLKMVVQGEREARHLVSMWNQFDETLTRIIGREIGHPVDSTSKET